jgi:hypothetical protein
MEDDTFFHVYAGMNGGWVWAHKESLGSGILGMRID